MIWKLDYHSNFPKYGNLGSDPQKLRFFENFFFYHQKNSILQKMSPQPLSGDDFKLKNVQNSDIDPIWPYFPKYGNLGPDPQKLRFFENSFFYHQKNSILQNISPQPLSGNDFKLKNGQNSDFDSIWPYFPKYGHLGSDPQNLSFYEIFFLSPKEFHSAKNEPSATIRQWF